MVFELGPAHFIPTDSELISIRFVFIFSGANADAHAPNGAAVS